MAYNSYYPAGYPQYPMPQQQSNGMIWVQGESGAKAYLIAPNTTVTLWDSEAQTIYIKSADATGMPNMKVLDYTIRTSVPNTAGFSPQSEYASKEDVDYLKNEIEALRAKFGEMEGKKK